MRSRLFTDAEIEAINDYMLKGKRDKFFNVLVYRMRKNRPSIMDDYNLLLKVLDKTLLKRGGKQDG